MIFGYVMLVVAHMDKSIGFYKTLLEKEPDFVGPRWAQFSFGKILIGLHALDSWSDPDDPLRKFGVGQKGGSFGLYVDNVEKVFEELTKNSIPVVHGPRQTGLGKTIYITDPDGYYIQICERNTDE